MVSRSGQVKVNSKASDDSESRAVFSMRRGHIGELDHSKAFGALHLFFLLTAVCPEALSPSSLCGG